MSIKVVVYSVLAIAGVATVAYNWKVLQETAANHRKAKQAYKDLKQTQTEG